MKVSEVKERLRVDTASVKNGTYLVRRGFFYSHGKTAADLEGQVRAAFPGAKIIDSGEVWKAFRGGASVAQQSHWFVRFTLPE